MLPDYLFIADAVAATFVFDPIMTARDRSIMLAVSWYAGQHPDEVVDDLILIPDLAMRRSLGDMRRPDAVWEEARYRRLEHATARGDETVPDLSEGVLVPTAPRASGAAPSRAKGNGPSSPASCAASRPIQAMSPSASRSLSWRALGRASPCNWH
jgi:hypothetical protein